MRGSGQYGLCKSRGTTELSRQQQICIFINFLGHVDAGRTGASVAMYVMEGLAHAPPM